MLDRYIARRLRRPRRERAVRVNTEVRLWLNLRSKATEIRRTKHFNGDAKEELSSATKSLRLEGNGANRDILRIDAPCGAFRRERACCAQRHELFIGLNDWDKDKFHGFEATDTNQLRAGRRLGTLARFRSPRTVSPAPQ